MKLAKGFVFIWLCFAFGLSAQTQVPLSYGETILLGKGNPVPAFRVEAFQENLPSGDIKRTRLEITLSGSEGDEFGLDVFGPLEAQGDGLEDPIRLLELERKNPSESAIVSEMEFPEPGVYLIQPNISSEQASSLFELTVNCKSLCNRPEISVEDFLGAIKKKKKTASFLEALKTKARMRLSPEGAQNLQRQLELRLKSVKREGMQRFPTLGPLSKLGALQPLLYGIESELTLKPARVFNGQRLEDIFAYCDSPERPLPSVIFSDMPEILSGHYPDLRLSTCETSHSPRLAQLLTSLSLYDSAKVRFRDETITSPQGLFKALIRSGHTVEMRNERTYANFIALTYEGKNVRWPVWLDTGIPLDETRTLKVPMGHSQHAWHVSGPLVNAQVMFFLSSSHGIAFFPKLDRRPEWTGNLVREVWSSKDPSNIKWISESLQFAKLFLKLVRGETQNGSSGPLPDGYGLSGICNDSNAVIEAALSGKTDSYPLVRDPKLNTDIDEAHPLAEILESLPNDAHLGPLKYSDETYRADAIRRILAMNPHDLSSEAFFDRALKADLLEAKTILEK